MSAHEHTFCRSKTKNEMVPGLYTFLVAFSVISTYLFAADALTVTRRKTNSTDLFSNPDPNAATTSTASQTCTNYSSKFVGGRCHNRNEGCTICECSAERPTFIAYLGMCVKDKDIRTNFNRRKLLASIYYYHCINCCSICRQG